MASIETVSDNYQFRPSFALILIIAIALITIGCSNVSVPSPPPRKLMPLERYGFTRKEHNNKSFEFLMGNGEMGGRILHSGLGLEKIWLADYWKDPEHRQFLPGFSLSNDIISNEKPLEYYSNLDISTASSITHSSFAGGMTYSSRLIFSFDKVGLLAIEVVNESKSSITLELTLPIDNFTVKLDDAYQLSGRNRNDKDYNQLAWALKSNLSINKKNEMIEVTIPALDTLEVFYSVATQFDAIDFELLAKSNLKDLKDFESAYKKHLEAWDGILASIGSVIIPDSDYAKWFYRSIYTNYATAGSSKFLAAETQFAYAEEDWDMHSFTYGHGSWAALSFMQFGDSIRAKRSLEWLYQPKSLKKNVFNLIPDTGRIDLTYHGKKVNGTTYLNSYPLDAFAFAHEQSDSGLNIAYRDDAHWDLQFHLNGFAASLFHRYNTYYYDPTFEHEVVYPVLRGTAEFWKGLVKSDSMGEGYILPPMLSLSENIVKPSVLDAVLAARWNLKMAGEYEKRISKVPTSEYSSIANKLIVPQNDTIYLEYKDDPQLRSGGGYFGIRACTYLGFPVLEQLDDIDKQKARATLDYAWKRNNGGKGMISFIANWFALTECYLHDGDKALSKSSRLLSYEDKDDVLLYEAFSYKGDSIYRKFNPYFLTGYSSLTLVPVAMMLQSYNGKIYFFPAMPSTWEHAEFYDMPVEGGYNIFGIYNGPNNYEVWIKKNNKITMYLRNTPEIAIEDIKS